MDELLEVIEAARLQVETIKAGVQSALKAVQAGDTDDAQEMLEALLGDGPEEADDDDEDEEE